MESIITVAGIGPGSLDYLLPAAHKAIDQATVLIGSRRALINLVREGQQQIVVDGNIAAVLDTIAEVPAYEKVVVLVSGDPGFYSLLAALKERFGSGRLKVIPGISSVQLAFARIGELWHDAVLTSMHGRYAEDSQLAYRQGKKLGLLTDGKHSPSYIACILLERDWPPDTPVWLCENLSYENENILETNLAEVSRVLGFTHSVMVVKA